MVLSTWISASCLLLRCEPARMICAAGNRNRSAYGRAKLSSAVLQLREQPMKRDSITPALSAARALDFVADGQIVGLGSGRAAAAFVRALAERVRAGLHIRGVPTSGRTAVAGNRTRHPAGRSRHDRRHRHRLRRRRRSRRADARYGKRPGRSDAARTGRRRGGKAMGDFGRGGQSFAGLRHPRRLAGRSRPLRRNLLPPPTGRLGIAIRTAPRERPDRASPTTATTSSTARSARWQTRPR